MMRAKCLAHSKPSVNCGFCRAAARAKVDPGTLSSRGMGGGREAETPEPLFLSAQGPAWGPRGSGGSCGSSTVGHLGTLLPIVPLCLWLLPSLIDTSWSSYPLFFSFSA